MKFRTHGVPSASNHHNILIKNVTSELFWNVIFKDKIAKKSLSQVSKSKKYAEKVLDIRTADF